jgi:hypothetical protein
MSNVRRHNSHWRLLQPRSFNDRHPLRRLRMWRPSIPSPRQPSRQHCVPLSILPEETRKRVRSLGLIQGGRNRDPSRFGVGSRAPLGREWPMVANEFLPEVRHYNLTYRRTPSWHANNCRRHLRRSNLVQYRQAYLGSVKAALGLHSRERRHVRTRLRGTATMNAHATVCRVPPNPSLKRSANGRPPGPAWWYAVHFHQSGPGVLPLSPA